MTSAADLALLDAAAKAWDAGDFRLAYARLREAAALGDWRSLLNIGYLHDEGLGHPRSKHEAMRWYRCALHRGDSSAASNVALLFRERGHGRAAWRWFVRAARLDDGDSELELARCWRDGLGTPTWRSRAIAHARRAARSTHITPAGRDAARTMLAALTRATRPGPRRIRRPR